MPQQSRLPFRPLAVRLLGLVALAAVATVPQLAATPPPPKAAPPAQPAAAEARRPVDRYVLVLGATMRTNTTASNVSRARKLAGPGGRLLWFRRDGTEHALRDPATLEAARKLFGRLTAVEAEQARLAAEQDRIERSLASLSEQEVERARQEEELGRHEAQLAEAGAKLAQSDEDEEGEEGAATQDDLERQSAMVRGELDDLVGEEDELARQQAGLSAEQEELAVRLRELSREEKSLARQVEAELAKLLDQALAKGLAPEIGR